MEYKASKATTGSGSGQPSAKVASSGSAPQAAQHVADAAQQQEQQQQPKKKKGFLASLFD
jgi:hypothetical protein